MIHFVSGEINSGKTSRIKDIYHKLGGDGIISEKIFENGDLLGYKFVRLSNGESVDSIYDNSCVPKDWKSTIKNIRFTFNLEAFDIAESWIDDIVSRGISPIYIDEVGKLELNKMGFYKILKKIIDLDVYIAIRSDYVEEFIKNEKMKNEAL